MSNTLTRNIRVRVESEYLPDQSEPQLSNYLFAYHIEISNEGIETVQLMNRHWYIRDAEDQTEEVEGAGVIGEQPVLEPGDSFSYSSFCPLKTPMGSMEGYYEMKKGDGSTFQVRIDRFALKAERMLH